MKQVAASIKANSKLMPGVYLMWLECPEIASTAQPGQFVMVRCGESSVLRRPLSIHRVANGNLALLFQVVGKGTEWLSQRRQGEFLDLFGPLGCGFDIHPRSRKLLLVAGGIGISPLVFLADTALTKRRSIRLILGAETRDEIYPLDLLPLGLELVATTGDATIGWKALVTGLFSYHAGWADQIFACGPTAMYRDMAHKKQELKLEGKPVQISLEVRMGCGLRVCYGCTLKTKSGLKQVCKDGPVFDLNDILWDELLYV